MGHGHRDFKFKVTKVTGKVMPHMLNSVPLKRLDLIGKVFRHGDFINVDVAKTGDNSTVIKVLYEQV